MFGITDFPTYLRSLIGYLFPVLGHMSIVGQSLCQKLRGFMALNVIVLSQCCLIGLGPGLVFRLRSGQKGGKIKHVGLNNDGNL